VNQYDSRDEAFIILNLNNQIPVQFKLDIGAQANILTARYFDTIKPPVEIKPTAQKQTSYCGSRIPVRGTCQVMGSYQSQVPSKLQFYLVKTNSVPIQGFRSNIDQNLVKLVLNVNKPTETNINNTIEQFKDVFEGIGKLEGICHFQVKKGVIPKVHPARTVQASLNNNNNNNNLFVIHLKQRSRKQTHTKKNF